MRFILLLLSSLFRKTKINLPDETLTESPIEDIEEELGLGDRPVTQPYISIKNKVTVHLVQQLFPFTKKSNIAEHLPLVLNALEKQTLCDKDIVCYVLATIAVENDQFLPLSEKPSKWSTKSGKKPYDFSKYEFREDLGNIKPGDGARFRGRSLLQCTGRANYTHMDKALRLDGGLISNPDAANVPQISAAILAQYMKDRELVIRAAVKNNDIAELRRIVNGGTMHLDKFEKVYLKARELL